MEKFSSLAQQIVGQERKMGLSFEWFVSLKNVQHLQRRRPKVMCSMEVQVRKQPLTRAFGAKIVNGRSWYIV